MKTASFCLAAVVTVLAGVSLGGASSRAQTADQQVYYNPYYAYQTYQAEQRRSTARERRQIQQQVRQMYGQPMSRSPYTNYTGLPNHPGDFRDAIDRGQYPGGSSVAPRSFRQ